MWPAWDVGNLPLHGGSCPVRHTQHRANVRAGFQLPHRSPAPPNLPEPHTALAERFGTAARSYTRSRYVPVRVSTRIVSPWFTNSGTLTTRPVSVLAGLVPPLAVSPRKPGSVSTISSSTLIGGSTSTGSCS